MTARNLDDEINRVVAAGNCSGCGLCSALDPGLTMQLTPAGYLRPVRRSGDPLTDSSTIAAFAAACPGRTVGAQHPDGAIRHDTMGPVRTIVAAWATDPVLRHRGGSGGALTALARWLLAEGDDVVVVGARAAADATMTEVARVTSADQIVSLAGSRYAPVSNAAEAAGLRERDVFVGKPCEVSAVRALAALDDQPAPPLLLAFFCAGTPSHRATQQLVHDLGMPEGERVAELWYRGRGWPGRFTAVGESGLTVSASYEESWGTTLGRALQWRCRICPDGVAESADIVAADLWDVDNAGNADFTESDAGVSALIARTARGADVVRRAIAAGVIGVGTANVEELALVQPLQRARRDSLAARLSAQRSAGGRVPRFAGFHLVRRVRLRAFVRVFRRARRHYRLTSGER